MNSLLKTFWDAWKHTPRGYFVPAIALWVLFCETAERVTQPVGSPASAQPDVPQSSDQASRRKH